MIQELAKILVLDDDISFLEQIPEILDSYGKVDVLRSIDQGLAAVESTYYDIVILDLHFDDDVRTGMDVFKKIVALDRGVDVVLITGETDTKKIFDLVNSGIRYFIAKPAKVNEMRECVRSILEERSYRRRATLLAQKMSIGKNGAVLVGSSPKITQLREHIDRLVKSQVKDVLIQGETGTGKELVARQIAAQCDSLGRFIPINCGSLNENLIQSELFGHVRGAFTGADRDKAGVFEAAGGGFVFLDEVGDMPITQQPKLLRAIQERRIVRLGEVEERAVSFRTISATHVDLRKAITESRFREDLYFRISKETITIPPLRERLEDIRDLVIHFLSTQTKKCTITEDALNLLRSYAWPGNVRELQSVVDRAVIRADKGVIKTAQIIQVLPELATLSSRKLQRAIVGSYGIQLLENERKRFRDAIISSSGNREEAAKTLGLSRATFYRKAKELGLVRDRKSGLGLI